MATNGDDNSGQVAKDEDVSKFDSKNSSFEQLGITSFKDTENQRPNSARRLSVLENDFILASSPRKGQYLPPLILDSLLSENKINIKKDRNLDLYCNPKK